MRSVLTASIYMTAIAIPLLLAPAFDAAPQTLEPDTGEYLPIHATISVRGEAMPEAFCTPHGFIIVWEGDLEATDDDPDGIFPARYYEAFDAPFTTMKFDDWSCGEGEGRITYTHRYGNAPSACVRLILVDEDASGNLDRTQWIDFTGFELGYVHISGDVTQPSAIAANGQFVPGTLIPPLALTAEDFERGFERTYHFGGTCDSPMQAPFACSHFGDHRVEGTLTLSYKQDTKKPKVEIAGCAHLLLGGSEQLTATGTPSGGRYRWSSETPSVLSASGTESGVDVKAGEPGHATVRVEYEAKNGKKAEATLPGSVVHLMNVNNAFPIPTVYLYDEEGHARPATEVPIKQEPPDGELLFFESADLGVASVTNNGSSLSIKGEHAGSTTAQAQTKCGEKAGPVLAINVANCSPETMEKLRERSNEAKRKIAESASRVTKELSSKDYIESSDGITEDIADAAIKTVDLTATVGGLAGHATEAAEVAEKIITGGAMGWDAAREGVKAMAVKHVISVLVPGSFGAIMVYDYIHSVGRLVEHARKLVEVDDDLVNEQAAQNDAAWEFEHVNALMEKCKKGSEAGQPPAKKEPAAPKPKPKPPAGKKGKEEPIPPEPPTPTEPGEPGGNEPPGTEPPVVEPPTPPTPPGGGTVGLPIDCGCKDASSAAWKDEENGLAAIAASLGLLRQCAENYGGELKKFQADSAAIVQAMSALDRALQTPGAKGFEMFKAAVPGLETTRSSLMRLSKASEEFKSTLEGCDTKVPEAVGIMNKTAQALATPPPELRSK